MTSEPTQPGTQIGAYRILSELGRGGMAVVHLAEQSEPVRRQVALKVLKAGMDTRQIVGRFEAERQTLAVMDHPNIAKVFDGGSTDSGYPYFVMELVRGVPITEYCDTHRVPISARLTLMHQVCSAVQHAHHKGIIHRDLKPSNILVTVRDGVPWPMVIDFGIAKLIRADNSQADHTRIGQLIGTPQYMSPEQAEMSGLDIDTRTDIYSLGCVLYELLVGTPPHDLHSVPAHAVGYALRETEVPRPSARLDTLTDEQTTLAVYRETDVKALRGMLRGDLDWVVMKAIAGDRTRRYNTADALAEDLVRFQAHQPVTAHPPSATYQLRRTLRRHRGAALAASAVLASVLAGAGAATYGLVQARQAGAQAQVEAQTSRQVTELMASLFEIADPERRGGKVTARQVVDEGLSRINQDLNGQPRVRAEMLTTVGRVYKNLGALDTAEQTLKQALALREQLDDTQSVAYAETQRVLANVYLLSTHVVEADQLLAKVLPVYETHLGRMSLPYAETLSELASAYGEEPLRDHEHAAALRREAITILEQLPGEKISLAETRAQLAFSLTRLRQYEEAEGLFLNSIAQLDRLAPENPLRNSIHRNNYSVLLYRTGRLVECAKVMREVLDIRREAYAGQPHPDTATSKRNLGLTMLSLGDNEQALSLIQAALAEMRELYGDAPNADVASALGDLGQVRVLMGEPNNAIDLFRQALGIRLEVQGETPQSAAMQLMLAEASIRDGRHREGLAYARAANAVYTEQYTGRSLRFWGGNATALEYWAREQLGEAVDAEPYLTGQYDYYVERGRTSGNYYLVTVSRLQLYHEQHGEPEQAARYQALYREATHHEE